METCPGQRLISQEAKKEIVLFKEQFLTCIWSMIKGNFIYIIMDTRSLFPCYQTFKLKLSGNDIFKTCGIFFSFLIQTLILGVVTPSLLSQGYRHLLFDVGSKPRYIWYNCEVQFSIS